MKAHATAWLFLLGTAVLATSAAAETPENNYMLRCQGCHRPDGSGIPGAVPPFPGVIAGFLATPAGRAFIVRVPGVANAPLSDAEVAQLLGWIVRRFDAANVPGDFVDYTAPEVAALRRQPLLRIADEREAILSELERGR
ncbi:MAG: cytochrome c [Deltaproteobacteria bacterium]|nr:cytochrome c [Deltaproteobacteria bacterium]